MNDQHHVRVMMITGWMDTVKQHWPDSVPNSEPYGW